MLRFLLVQNAMTRKVDSVIVRRLCAVRAVLLQPPGNCKIFTRSQSVYPPLGLCQLASTVPAKDCQVLDAEGLNLSKEETIRRVVEFRPSLVGFTVTTMTMTLVNSYAQAIKAVDPTILMICGGPQATAAPDTVLRECPSIDAVFRGEGETVFPAMIKVLDPRIRSLQHHLSAIGSLPGVVPRSQHHVARTIAVQRVSKDLFVGNADIGISPLPFPALDRLPIL